jgi:hypothetical protein
MSVVIGHAAVALSSAMQAARSTAGMGTPLLAAAFAGAAVAVSALLPMVVLAISMPMPPKPSCPLLTSRMSTLCVPRNQVMARTAANSSAATAASCSKRLLRGPRPAAACNSTTGLFRTSSKLFGYAIEA